MSGTKPNPGNKRLATKDVQIDSLIGARIRTVRKAKSITLKQLSARSKVSIATLSKIETGKVTGSFNTIYKIARGLEVLVTSILNPVADELAGEESVRVVTRSDRDQHPTQIYRYQLLANRNRGELTPYVIEVLTDQLPDPVDWSLHAGEEVIYVLSGAIDLYVENRQRIPLQTGDSAVFNCGLRHAFVRTSESPARLLSVSTRGGAGERPPLP